MNYLTIVPSHGGLAKAFGLSFVRYRPQILAGVGVVSFMSATVSAVKATPKAMDKLEKIDILLNLAFQSAVSLKYRDYFRRKSDDLACY